ncbi:MAG: SRPBCC family protein [Actinomycetota bacterium]
MSAARGAVVTRVMPARPEVVYDEWLDQAALAEFMCPSPDTRATTIACDPRIGGKLTIVMGDPAGDVHITGEYVALERPRRLSFTWRHEGGVDSVVTITFEPHGEDAHDDQPRPAPAASGSRSRGGMDQHRPAPRDEAQAASLNDARSRTLGSSQPRDQVIVTLTEPKY